MTTTTTTTTTNEVRAQVADLLAGCDTPEDARLWAVSMHQRAETEAEAAVRASAPGSGRRLAEAEHWRAVAASLAPKRSR